MTNYFRVNWEDGKASPTNIKDHSHQTRDDVESRVDDPDEIDDGDENDQSLNLVHLKKLRFIERSKTRKRRNSDVEKPANKSERYQKKLENL